MAKPRSRPLRTLRVALALAVASVLVAPLGTAAGDHDHAGRQPVVRAAIDHDRPPRLARLARDDRDRERLVREAVAQLEQAGELLVLAPELGRGAALGLEPVVLLAQLRVLLSEPVDLRDRRGDRGHVAGDAADGDLDRLERERHAVLDVAHQRVRRHGHEDERRHEQGDVGDGPTADGLVRENGGHRWIVAPATGAGDSP